MMASSDTPSVSVALSVLNGERFLGEQLESIARQTLPPLELVVCDDCSTDGTPQLLEDFRRHAPFPVHLRRNRENLGPWDSFLRIARLCVGRYIAFADADDVWLDHKLQRLVGAVTAIVSPVSLVAHSYDVVDADLRPVGSGPIRRRRHLSSEQVPLFDSYNGFSLFFDRTLLDIPIDDWNRPEDVHHVDRPGVRWDPRMSHDKWVVFLSALDRGLLLIPDRLVLYRQHGENHSGASTYGVAANLRRMRLANREHYMRLARLANERADTLAAVAMHPEARASVAEHARARSVVFRSFADVVRARAELYDRDLGFLSRLGRWARLVTRHAYRRQTSGGVGMRAAIKDLVVALVGPAFLAL